MRFEKSACIEYMNVAEKDCKLPEFYQGVLTFKSFKTYLKKYLLDDEYPAHLAAYNGNLQLLSMLISEGHCHINQSDPLGCSPAHKGHQHNFASFDLIGAFAFLNKQHPVMVIVIVSSG